ncbi:hypothetical protein H9P43_001690 [Blastocladiella emersonii ATCC 22665]|nr:hypothetical protein H9P43_001690 [Blastocladiella emersonii ATCC 22665]
MSSAAIDASTAETAPAPPRLIVRQKRRKSAHQADGSFASLPSSPVPTPDVETRKLMLVEATLPTPPETDVDRLSSSQLGSALDDSTITVSASDITVATAPAAEGSSAAPVKKTKKVIRRVLVLKDTGVPVERRSSGSASGSDLGTPSSSPPQSTIAADGTTALRVVRRRTKANRDSVVQGGDSDAAATVTVSRDAIAPAPAAAFSPRPASIRKSGGSSVRRASVRPAAAAPGVVRAPEPYAKDPYSIHALPAHRKLAHSPLSSEAPEQSYRGLVNVAALVLVVSNLRLILSNLLKYGLLIGIPTGASMPTGDVAVAIGLLAFHAANIFISYAIEREGAEQGVVFFFSEKTWRSLAAINLASILVVPLVWVWLAVGHPAIGIGLLMITTILFLKLTSYHLVNAELRYFHAYGYGIATYTGNQSGGVSTRGQYPTNISLGNLVEFLTFPTLCYQPSYPRTPRVRVRKVIKHAVETFVCVSLMYIILFQHMQPILDGTVRAITDPVTGNLKFDGFTAATFLERLLKLSLAVVPFWLIMFVALFHSWVNLVAEVTRFADREFYKEWWNASTIAAYWRLWNIPVHNWLKRHVYIPMVAGRGLPDPHVSPSAAKEAAAAKGKAAGYSKFQAALAIFFISAVFHEYIIAPPVKIFQLHAFNAMFLQIPLIVVTQVIDNWYRVRHPEGINVFGNLLMWTAFCVIGQPMGGVMYYVQYVGRAAQGSV